MFIELSLLGRAVIVFEYTYYSFENYNRVLLVKLYKVEVSNEKWNKAIILG